jgi:hypothetical protein
LTSLVFCFSNNLPFCIASPHLKEAFFLYPLIPPISIFVYLKIPPQHP